MPRAPPPKAVAAPAPPVPASPPKPSGKTAKAAPPPPVVAPSPTRGASQSPTPPPAPTAARGRNARGASGSEGALAGSQPAAKRSRARREPSADGTPPTVKQERAFTVFSSTIDHLGGRFISKNPESAAKKAGHQQFRKLDAWGKAAPETTPSGVPVIKFALRENGEKNKVRKYAVTREEKESPDRVIRVIKGGNPDKSDKTIEIIHRYNYDVSPLGEMPPEEVSEISAARRKRRTKSPEPPVEEAKPAPRPAGKRAHKPVPPPEPARAPAAKPSPTARGRKAAA